MRRKFFIGVICLAIVGINIASPEIVTADDLIVIGNRSVPVSTLTEKEVKRIYLGKMKMWDNGLKVIFVKSGNDQNSERFLKHFVKKNPGTYNKYWEKSVFTGGNNPPQEFKREQDLVQYVAETKGAVGYISSKLRTDSVKILSVMH